MSDVTVRLNVNVVGCGKAGDVVPVPSTQAARMVERGKAELVGRKGVVPRAATAAPIAEWPENSGITATRPQLSEIARRTGVKVEWLEAAANRIKAGDAVPTEEILAAIAVRATLRKEVLALAEAYVIHTEMAAQLAAQEAQGAHSATAGADGAQDDAGEDGGPQGDVGGPAAEGQE